MQISQSCDFGGLGEDQNVSLATERWNINNKWNTPSAVKGIAKLFTTFKAFSKQQLEVLENTDRRASSQRCQNGRGKTYKASDQSIEIVDDQKD